MQKTDELQTLGIDGAWFVNASGHRVYLRGINLGGDCKLPASEKDGQISFIGRPFPLAEADSHFARLRHWGFNCIRLLTTWEAVMPAADDQTDTDYVAYFRAICAKAGEYGFYVFVDFHQDVWSRPTGGDGAPIWTLTNTGISVEAIESSQAAFTMQGQWNHHDSRLRQPENYAPMSWPENYDRPANRIMWSLFFGGQHVTPDFTIKGQNIQEYLQSAYFRAVTAIATAIADLPHVIGFDTLNEPGSGLLGRALSYRHLASNDICPAHALPGPALTGLESLLAAQGIPQPVPTLKRLPDSFDVVQNGETLFNPNAVRLWQDGVECPFAKAGIYLLHPDGSSQILRENAFQQKANGEQLDVLRDCFVPFFQRMADVIRSVRSDWLVFVELDAFCGATSQAFPENMPENAVNATHWYDLPTLYHKTLVAAGDDAAMIRNYIDQLAPIQHASQSLNQGRSAPTLIGEFGIPFDMDQGAAYEDFAKGNRSNAPWHKQIRTLARIYDAMDSLLLHSCLWNYTASNRNHAMIGDGWNQEDLSIYSIDQHDSSTGLDSGGRAIAGFCRPYPRRFEGDITRFQWDMEQRSISIDWVANKISAILEVFIPARLLADGYDMAGGTECEIHHDADCQSLFITALQAKSFQIRVIAKPSQPVKQQQVA